jgi:hypothetical protein
MCSVRYENWIAGKDLGYHPEDDPKSNKMSLAPQPSLDEFMVNKTNLHELVNFYKDYCFSLGLNSGG